MVLESVVFIVLVSPLSLRIPTVWFGVCSFYCHCISIKLANPNCVVLVSVDFLGIESPLSLRNPTVFSVTGASTVFSVTGDSTVWFWGLSFSLLLCLH